MRQWAAQGERCEWSNGTLLQSYATSALTRSLLAREIPISEIPGRARPLCSCCPAILASLCFFRSCRSMLRASEHSPRRIFFTAVADRT